jgi:DNA-3-methyladenine glycosylase II
MTQVDIALPPGYRTADVLAFHARDGEGVAEQVHAAGFRKGVMLHGVPVRFDVTFADGVARCALAADGVLPGDAADALTGMLGLLIDPAPFAAAVRHDPLLGPLVARTPGLRIVQSASVFEALTWAVIGQQINLPFAISLRRTLILQAGRQHGSGIWCYPEAANVAALDIADLTSRKFSRAKAETILRLAQMVESGALSLARDVPVHRAVDSQLRAAARIRVCGLFAAGGCGRALCVAAVIRGRRQAGYCAHRSLAGAVRAIPDDGGGVLVG